MTAAIAALALMLFAFGYVAGVTVMRARWLNADTAAWRHLAKRDQRRHPTNHDDFLN